MKSSLSVWQQGKLLIISSWNFMIDVLKKCVGLKRVRSYLGCCIVCIDNQLFYDMSKLYSLPNRAKFGRWFRFSAIVLLGWKRRKSWIHSIANISMGRSWSPLSGRLGCSLERTSRRCLSRDSDSAGRAQN